MGNAHLTVLIAEDEGRILSLIKSLIDWDGLSLKLIGEATDGDAALQLISRERPDIIITDIRMPGANGLSVAEWVNEHLPQSHVIVISGYKKFDYAYDALKLNVSDFLLKPINREDLNRSLAKIVDQHSSEAARALKGKQRESEIEKTRANLRRQCLLTLLFSPHASISELAQFNANNAMNFEPGLYYAIALHVFNPRTPFEKYIQQISKPALNESNARVPSIVAIKLKDVLLRELSPLNIDIEGAVDGDMMYLIGNIHTSQLNALRRACARIYDTMREHAAIFPEIDFSMGVSGVRESHIHLSECLAEAANALVCNCAMDTPATIFADRLEIPESVPLFPSLEREFRAAIEVHDIPRIQQAFRKRFEELLPAIRRAPLLLNDAISQLLNIMWSTASDRLQIVPFDLQVAMRHYARFAGNDLGAFCRHICDVLKYQYELWFEKTESSESLPVRIVKKHIQEHYREPLTLEALAELANFSESHLSAVFKRETQSTVSEYITQCRMERAKELLTTSMMNIGEIAEAVGYQDAKYFSRVFHRQVHIKPSEYRQLHHWCDIQ